MSSIKSALVGYLTEAGISYRSGEDPTVFLAPFRLDAGDVTLLCCCQDEVSELLIRVMFPFLVPPQHQSNVAELLGLVNHVLSLGCFEMDHSNGRLGFRIGIDAENAQLTSPLIRNLIDRALRAANYFYTPLASVADGRLGPDQALSMSCPREPGASADILLMRLSSQRTGKSRTQCH